MHGITTDRQPLVVQSTSAAASRHEPPAGQSGTAPAAVTVPAAAPAVAQAEFPATPLFSGERDTSLRPGLGTLFALAAELRPDQLALLPARSAQLLALLPQWFAAPDELADIRKLRQQFSRAGLLPDSAASVATAPSAVSAAAPGTAQNALLLQLLLSLQAGRRLELKNGKISFALDGPATAYSLQVYGEGEEQADGGQGSRLRAMVARNAESALLALLGAQQQALSRSNGEKPHRIMQLLLRHQQQALVVPVQLSWQEAPLPDMWEARFSLELAHAGSLHVVLAVKKSAVSVSITTGGEQTRDALVTRRDRLGRMLTGQGLTLAGFTCSEADHA